MKKDNTSCYFYDQIITQYYILISIIVLFFFSYNNKAILYKPIVFILISFLMISILYALNARFIYILFISFVFFFYLIVLNINSNRAFYPSFNPKDITRIEGYVIKDQISTKSDSLYIKINCNKGYLKDGTIVSVKGQIPILLKDDYNLLYRTPILADVKYNEDINLYKAKAIKVLSKNSKLSDYEKNLLFNIRDNRYYLIEKIKTYLKCPLARMLILGRSDQEGFIYKEYALKLGCAHLLALSGMHLSIISMFFIFFFSHFLSRKKAKFFSLFVLSFFIYITGLIPSLVRSYIMYILSIFNLKIFKNSEIVLLFSAIIQALVFPSTFISAGCLFSYGALSAIFIYSSIYDIKNKLLNIILTTVFAILITYPLSLSLGGNWCIFSIILAPLLTIFITFEMIIALSVVLNSVIIDFNNYYNFRHFHTIIEAVLELVTNIIREINFYLQRIMHYNERLIREIFNKFDFFIEKMPKTLITYKGYLIFALIVLTSTVWYLYSRGSFKIRSNTINELGFPIRK